MSYGQSSIPACRNGASTSNAAPARHANMLQPPRSAGVFPEPPKEGVLETLFARDDFEAAAGLVYETLIPTPQLAWPMLAKRTGSEVWVKHENHTPIGAFKVRGGLVLLDHLVRSNGVGNGLITATRGNHGQSIPFAARRHGVPVKVLAPCGNSLEKNAAMRAWGAELMEHGEDFDEAYIEARRLARELHLTMVPSFSRELVLGVSTYAMELLSAVSDLHTVYVPIGLGSGICGVTTTRDLLGLKTDVVGVVSTEAAAYAHSFEAGQARTTNSVRTFADGIATRNPDPQALEIICKGAERIVQVTDDEITEAMRIYFEDTHNVVEGAAAAPLAALM